MDIKRPRRRHSIELKAQVLAECDAPGTSVAAVAQAHGLNCNLVHKWRRGCGAKRSVPGVLTQTTLAPSFVPLSLSAPSSMPAQVQEATTAAACGGNDIRLELQRGTLAVNIAWPVSAAGECAAWLSGLLR